MASPLFSTPSIDPKAGQARSESWKGDHLQSCPDRTEALESDPAPLPSILPNFH